MHLPTVTPILNWRNETNKSGEYPIHLRITINRKSKYYKIPLPQKVKESQWSDKEDSWVKNHPFAFEINNKIIEKKMVVNELVKRNYNANKSLSFAIIFKHLLRTDNGKSFYVYMKEYIANPPKKLASNTIKKFNTCLTHLKLFRNELIFSDIDNVLIHEFNKFMQAELKLIGSSRKKYMESFKAVIKQARKEEYIDATQMEFLFDDVKINVGKAKRTYLEIPEIKAWKAVTFPKEKEYLKRDRDIFLFQIYTGYYYNDLPIFTKNQLVNDEEYGLFIIGARDKNGNQTIIPLFKFPHAEVILKRYQSTADETIVFKQSVFIEEQAYNRNLKEIAKLADIPKSISNKVARHTNAQLWVRYGAERPILSKMMGHTNEETTSEYFSVNLPEIVEGTKRADFKKLGI